MPTIWIIAYVLQWIVVVFLICIMAGVLRYLGSIQDKIEDVIPRTSRFVRGEQALKFELPDLQGHLVTSNDLLKNEQKLLLLFLSTTCDSCRLLLSDIAEFIAISRSLIVPGSSIVLICIGQSGDVTQMIDEHRERLGRTHVLVDEDGIVTRQYGIRGVPFGMILNKHSQVMQQSISPTLDWLQNMIGITTVSSEKDGGKEEIATVARKMKRTNGE